MNRNPPSPVDPDTISAVSMLMIETRRVVEGLQGGAHRSPHLGASVEFDEHKKYNPGDDIRHIDWRALARTDRYFVKQHQRDVVLSCLMALDCSPSMAYQGIRAVKNKLDYGVSLLAAFAHILVRQGDEAGLITFDERPLQFLPPAQRADQLTALMTHLAEVQPAEKGETGYLEAIKHVADRAGRRRMITLVTDLWGAAGRTELALAKLSTRGHDVVLFHVLDPDELDLPFDRPTLFRDMESRLEVDVDPAQIRVEYKKEIHAHCNHWRKVCSEAKIDYCQTVTSRPPAHVLSDFVAQRAKKRRGR